MGVPERRARHKASLRRDILAAASRLFVQEGFDRVTMRKIAARIEYSPTTIYLHFKDKRELLRAVCDEAFARLAEDMAHVERTPDAPLTALQEALRTYVEFGLTHPHHYTAAFLTPREAGQSGVVSAAAVLGGLQRDVEACATRGELRTDDAELTAQTLWAGVHGVTSLLIAMKGSGLRPRKALIESMVALLIAGLRPAQASAPSQPQAAPRPAPRPTPSRDFSFMD